MPGGEDEVDLAKHFSHALREAERLADDLGRRWVDADLKKTEEDLIPFLYFEASGQGAPESR